jgi:hypothetical protein
MAQKRHGNTSRVRCSIILLEGAVGVAILIYVADGYYRIS